VRSQGRTVDERTHAFPHFRQIAVAETHHAPCGSASSTDAADPGVVGRKPRAPRRRRNGAHRGRSRTRSPGCDRTAGRNCEPEPIYCHLQGGRRPRAATWRLPSRPCGWTRYGRGDGQGSAEHGPTTVATRSSPVRQVRPSIAARRRAAMCSVATARALSRSGRSQTISMGRNIPSGSRSRMTAFQSKSISTEAM